ncbi:RagB/SusD family nutrient uptake outer membrane protein [Thermoflavifilum thermophilum]|uniref:SusD family protein n=1 Tax=Thermoflavifilum thermophilum TaxID=1393122 RepID=A0A1I7NG68_9BACT|nr:RagB/SusD family nutrient uptake outer membrane protein [Thermoflavifilum thermophilum]SFV33583.1 SusD family protein [Thermoflavifilum thermophilum]
MKKLLIHISLLTAALLFSLSCSKEFLNRVPYDSYPTSASLNTANDLRTALNGMYSGLKSVNLFGRTLPILGDLLGGNIYISTKNSGRYIPYQNLTYTVADGDASGIWIDAYNVILRANNIINANVPSSPVVDDIKGQAKAVRALLYFELITHFASPYMVNASGAGVPLITKYDLFLKPARDKISDVYNQIISDLTDGYNTMNSLNSNSSYMNKWAARALQAKVYLYMGDYANALAAALDVVTNSGFKMVTNSAYLGYWANPNPRSDKLETLFEVSFDQVYNLATNSLAFFYDQTGYGDALCSPELYALYTSTDIRKQLIIKGSPVRGANALVVNKYPNKTNNNDDDTKVIRFTDVMLILAEAYARTGNDVNALFWLNKVATDRDPSFTGYTDTGAALINDILTERQKEMAFEGDYYYTNYYRLNLDITNRGAGFPASARVFLASNPRRILPIPQGEIDNNPNITQNPGY